MRRSCAYARPVKTPTLATTMTIAVAILRTRNTLFLQVDVPRRVRRDQLEEDGARWLVDEWRAPERARDARAKQLGDGQEVGAGEPRPHEGEQRDDQAG